VILVAVGLLLQRTRLGTAMRAVADNRDLAESSGIDVKRVILAVWVMGGSLAALGGVLQGLTSRTITFDMGFGLLLLMFAGVIVGGIGTAYGAMVGGVFVGLASEVSTFWFSVELKLMFAFLLLIAVLLVRPQGILGRRERVG
jgi:branched-chain amino acid transport system permease protein